MKLIKKISSLGLLGLSLSAASIAPANAIPYGTNTVYKANVTTSAGTATYVYISSTPNGRVQVALGSTERTQARVVGACGEVRIPVPTNGSFAGLKVDGTAIDVSTLPVQTLPTCVSGSFSEPRTANFKTANGQVVIIGKTANSAATVTLPVEVNRNVTINGCGFGVLRPSSGSTLPATINVSGTDYTLASLPDAGKPPICQTSNGQSFGYVPQSWP